MKFFKQTVSLFMAIAMLCAVPVAVRAQEAGDEFADPYMPQGIEQADSELSAANESGYPAIYLGGGFHPLYFDESDPDKKAAAFDTRNIDFKPLKEELLTALKGLKLDHTVDLIKEAAWEWFGPVRFNEHGKSEADNISCIGDRYSTKNLNRDLIECYLDWRQSPLDNADELHKFLEWIKQERGVQKFHLKGMSGSGAIVLAYLKKYKYGNVASVSFDITMQNGSTLFGEVAKRKFALDAKSLGKASAIKMGSINIDISGGQPWLNILYESGLLDVTSKLLTLGTKRMINRLYDEVFIPLLFTMPVFWGYVPQKDYEAAKKALLADAKYAGLVKKLDEYRKEVVLQADSIVLDAAKNVKLAVRANYGLPMVPFGKGTAVQSDGLVDTAFASLGATCAPIGEPFGAGHKQKAGACHDHMSPDRLVDASTCLLPDQTWFAYGKDHSSDGNYSGWYNWFINTDNPTVHTSEDYPQFVELTEAFTFVPRKAESASRSFLETLKAAGLWLLKIWRWLVLLPWFWV